MFTSRGREMPESNLRQADVPDGATAIRQTKGTAPGLICPVGQKVLYAVPGVPYEMADMFVRAIAPTSRRRMAERGESAGVIASRVIRTWGMSESGLAEALAGSHRRPRRGCGPVAADGGAATIAFLASGIEGIKVRVTVRAADQAAAACCSTRRRRTIRAMLERGSG